jgi:hypothetical protein
MLSQNELREQASIARQAEALANRGGERPKLEPLTLGIFTAIGIFALLDIFAALTLPDRNSAFWPIVIITLIGGGGAATIQWRREKAWLSRHTQAVNDIESISRPNHES